MVTCTLLSWTEQYSEVIKLPRTHILIFSYRYSNTKPWKATPAAFHKLLLSSGERKSWPEIFVELFCGHLSYSSMRGPNIQWHRGLILAATELLQTFLRLHPGGQMRCVYIPASPHLLIPNLLLTQSFAPPHPFLRFLCCSHLTQQPIPSHLNTKLLCNFSICSTRSSHLLILNSA